jgi:hypothetical protein
MSPYKGLDSPISLQSWNHQLKVSSVTDKRIKQYADFFTQNEAYYPEVGASCVNADFVAHPLVVGDASSQAGPTDPATTPTAAAGSTAATSSSAG